MRPGSFSKPRTIFGDHATVEACRRVIDAGLNGKPAAPSDLHIVHDYFR